MNVRPCAPMLVAGLLLAGFPFAAGGPGAMLLGLPPGVASDLFMGGRVTTTGPA